jgi:hypothetical protein
MGVSFIGGENRSTWRKPHQTISHNDVSSTPRLSGIRSHNVTGDRH